MAEQGLEQGFAEGRPGMESLLDQFEQHWGELQQRLGWKEEFTPVLLTFGVLVATLVFIAWVVRTWFSEKKRDTILLVGLSGAGKTALFYQLRDGSTHQGTVTSMEPNEGLFILYSETKQLDGSGKGKKIRPVHIVDCPGHPRLKAKMDEFLPQACGIVFVIDALDFMPQVRPTAEHLYNVLTKAVVVRKKTPVLLACNKVDKVTAHSVDFIRRQLEKEIEKLRTTRKATFEADLGTDVMIGSTTEAFEFTQCVNKVSSCEVSALHGKISAVEQFIRDNVKI